MNSRLEADSLFLVDLPLSQLRLMKDGEVDWFLLIPRRQTITEWIDLNQEDQLQLLSELQLVSHALKKHSNPTKINIGALGNIVKQFHLHLIARKENDRAWPGPIWGTKSLKDFDDKKLHFWKNYFQTYNVSSTSG